MAGGADDVSGDVAIWLRRWRDRLSHEDQGMPDDEARLVIEAVLEELRGGYPENLERAGRAWGRAHRSVSEMVGRLSSFREALAASGVDDPLKMHRALDRVTAAATEEVLHRLEHASRTDALTGVGNRRAFDETLSAALSAASRQRHEVTVVAVDLDGLKHINDTEGHAAGDSTLLALVRAFYVALRDEDTVFRVGGDEFVVLLPFTSVDAAELLMERIHAGGAPAFTWGAAGYPGDGTDASDLVDVADQDLYRRREMRRSLIPVPATQPAASPSRALAAAPALRWAWIPAAAVLVVSLVATLVSTGTHTGTLAGGPRPTHVATKPAGGHHSSSPTPPPSQGAHQGTSASRGTGSSIQDVGFSTPPRTSRPGGQSHNPGSSPGSPPGSTTTTTTPPGSGGLLGTVQNALAPVPVVGPTGAAVVALVGHVLSGAPSNPVTTTSASRASASRASSASSAATGPLGLLEVVGGLLS